MNAVEALLAWAGSLLRAGLKSLEAVTTVLQSLMVARYSRLADEFEDSVKEQRSTAIFADEEARRNVARTAQKPCRAL